MTFGNMAIFFKIKPSCLRHLNLKKLLSPKSRSLLWNIQFTELYCEWTGLSELVTQLFAISKLDDCSAELNFKLESTSMSENWKLLFPCFASCERSLCHDRFKSNSWTCLAEKLKQPFALILRFGYCKADRYRVSLWECESLIHFWRV